MKLPYKLTRVLHVLFALILGVMGLFLFMFSLVYGWNLAGGYYETGELLSLTLTLTSMFFFMLIGICFIAGAISELMG